MQTIITHYNPLGGYRPIGACLKTDSGRKLFGSGATTTMAVADLIRTNFSELGTEVRVLKESFGDQWDKMTDHCLGFLVVERGLFSLEEKAH